MFSPSFTGTTIILGCYIYCFMNRRTDMRVQKYALFLSRKGFGCFFLATRMRIASFCHIILWRAGYYSVILTVRVRTIPPFYLVGAKIFRVG